MSLNIFLTLRTNQGLNETQKFFDQLR